MDQNKVWSKIFGFLIPSHTVPNTSYTVAMTENGWSCNCMDMKIRKGSYEIVFDTQRFQACKHVIDHLKNLKQKDQEENSMYHLLKTRKITEYSVHWRVES